MKIVLPLAGKLVTFVVVAVDAVEGNIPRLLVPTLVPTHT